MRILTCSEAHEAASGPEADPQILMRRAGYAVAQFCASQFKFGSVCVVCGKGNKGGAGLIAAEALQRVAETVAVIILAKQADELSPDVAACLRPDVRPIWIADEADFAGDAAQEALGADLVIDAIVGTGFKAPLRGLAATAVAAINDASGTIVAVDVPSGVDADSRTAVRETGGNMVFAHAILALIAPKPAHVFGELTSGAIAVSEIGVQPAFVANETAVDVITGRDVGITFPPRPNDAPKGQFGHVLVVAGSLGEAGAAALAGLAAMSTGAGAVTVACPKSIQATVAGFSAALMTRGLAETDDGTIAVQASDRIDALLAGKDVVVLGPGLSRNPETAAFVRRLASACGLPLVLDGDGLNAFEGHYQELAPRGGAAPFRVLTLNPAQAARLTGAAIGDIQADRVGAARRVSRETGACVVLKGWRTVVAGVSDETWINMSGNPALAKAGAGDVLSGMIGAVLARHSGDAADAADPAPAGERPLHHAFLQDLHVAAAVHLHGLAGDIARDALHENTVAAPDLIEALAEAFWECERQVERNLFYLRK
jgi:ADP-dependent NAD(P)H-hydrate dehydratase / NAD(P)H-hydrate epimerase